jgi:fructosamine-3-kinase
VLWTDDGAVLINPAAHGGHRETDLAMLALFGLPEVAQVVEGYEEVHAPRPGWRRRLGLHQLFPVGVHAAGVRGRLRRPDPGARPAVGGRRG